MKDGYRDKALLNTKCSVWNVTKHSNFEKYLDEELMRLGTDHIDDYLLHNMTHSHWEIVKKYDGLGFLDNMVRK